MSNIVKYKLSQIEEHTLNATPVPIEIYQIIDGELLFLYANKEALDFYSAKNIDELSALYEKDPNIHTHENDKLRVNEIISRAVENKTKEYDATYRSFDIKKGEYIWVNEHGKIVHDYFGFDIAYVTYTNPNKYEALFAKPGDSLLCEQAQKDDTGFQDALLSRLSHNLRTPMNAIINLAGFGLDEAMDNKIVEYFSNIKSSSEYLLGTLNDMLDLNTIKSGQIELRPSIVDFESDINDILATYVPKADKKDIAFKYVKKGHAPMYIFADKFRFNQIITNLLSNAIKYTPNFGKVYLKIKFHRARDKRLLLHIEVIDNGIGMSEEFIDKIFLPFAREHNNLMYVGDGSGLGLTIVNNLVNLMGGEIQVKSKYGKGSAFTITIPTMEITNEEYYEKTRSKIDISQISRLNDKRILVVDDHELNLKILEKILKSAGCKVEIANNGLEAYETYKVYPKDYFDGILMDIKMPLMDGYSCTKKIREENEEIPIIMLSANAYSEDIKLSLKKGANAHLSKPIEKEKLLNTMEFFIANK